MRVVGLIASGIVSLMSVAGCVTVNVNRADLPDNSLPAPSALVGTWDVTLRHDPNAAPSKTEMRITSTLDGKLEGTFYGSPFAVGRLAAKDATWVLAARTSDPSGPYWHSARLEADGSLEGQTLSEGRGFLMTWRAVRK